MKCKKCQTPITIDDISLITDESKYLQIDIDCCKCGTVYWSKIGLWEFASNLDLEEEQD